MIGKACDAREKAKTGLMYKCYGRLIILVALGDNCVDAEIAQFPYKPPEGFGVLPSPWKEKSSNQAVCPQDGGLSIRLMSNRLEHKMPVHVSRLQSITDEVAPPLQSYQLTLS
jgi:hypothetical protein